MKLFNSITLIGLITANLAFPTIHNAENSKSIEIVQDINAKSEIADSKLSATNSEESNDITDQVEAPIDSEELPKLRTIFPGFRIPIIDSVLESTFRPILEGAIINPIKNIIGNNDYDEQTEEDMKEFLYLLQNIKH